MDDRDFIKVIRCINCCCYIPINNISCCGLDDEFAETAKVVKADGYCDNIGIWVRESDYCSFAEQKER